MRTPGESLIIRAKHGRCCPRHQPDQSTDVQSREVGLCHSRTMDRGVGVFGPGVPGRVQRSTPWGRRRMRVVLTLHLARLRELGVTPAELAAVEAELRRFGGTT